MFVRRYRNQTRLVIAATLVLAATLRLWGISFGRGALTARPDEELLRSGVLGAMIGDLNPHYAVWGHLFHYIYAGAAAVLLGVQVLTDVAPDWTGAVALAHGDSSVFFLLGRTISTIAGTAAVFATYRLARSTLRSRLTAAVSALLLATLFLHVRDSHFATCDVLLSLTTTAALAWGMSARRPPCLTGREPVSTFRAAAWSSVALATKLSAAPLVPTYATVCLRDALLARSTCGWLGVAWRLMCFGLCTLVGWLVLQPFLLLDPQETWFGLFDDLFNPDRRPFERGVNVTTAKVVVLYYVPAAFGWLVGTLSGVGAILLLARWRTRGAVVLLAYAAWMGLSVISVREVFLRYLEPLLPVACILAAHAIRVICRRVVPSRAVWLATMVVACAAATPNLIRGALLDGLLSRPDSRLLAKEWLERDAPADGLRVYWAGFGEIAAHLTMPVVEPSQTYVAEYIAQRRDRGLPTAVESRLDESVRTAKVRRFELVSLDLGKSRPAQSGLLAFPMLDHHYELPRCLEAISEWSRGVGLVTRATPRLDVVRRRVAGTVGMTRAELVSSGAEYVVVTSVQPGACEADEFAPAYRLAAEFGPGPGAGTASFDWGDAWWLPNAGLWHVDRPGPFIWIFRRGGGD